MVNFVSSPAQKSRSEYTSTATSERQAVSFGMEMSQTGFSAHYSKDWVMLGAVGAYDWNGTVVMIKSDAIVTPGNNSFQTKAEERNEPLAAYLGYSVTSASVHGEQIYIAGQPRHNHTGQVIVYQMNGHNIIVLQTLKGEQIGSYFGSVLTTVDVDDDSLTDILLVGAPMYMGSEKQEQGKVYVYRIDKVFFLHLHSAPGLEAGNMLEENLVSRSQEVARWSFMDYQMRGCCSSGTGLAVYSSINCHFEKRRAVQSVRRHNEESRVSAERHVCVKSELWRHIQTTNQKRQCE
ncbi:unnamed protein product [Ranitomeya imitator]|uniref:Uncharacterized protein n=1 Tax=Ranitomeya imitator TaxID=111125 RepID=A0ABN9KZR6_9NEOB|nr:unnamed protein product [Ranitomeya imitator]